MFSDLRPLEGGHSGETFLAEAGGERSVVRIFASPKHHPQAAEIQEAVLRLVRGLVPVPRVLEVRPAGETPGLLVTEFCSGVRGDLVLPRLSEAELARVGEAVGRIAGTLAGMPFLTRGPFADPELRIERREFDPALPELAGLDRVVDRARARLDAVGRASLVHSDLNPKNLLLDPDSLEVTAVLDWEFSHAGSPFADLGNLLRFDRPEAYVSGAVRGYTAVRGGDPDEVLDLARCADLPALVELGGRRGANPVADRAYEHLVAIADSGDVHAVPKN